MDVATPDFQTVYDYARKSVDYFVRKHANHLCGELKEECIQNAMVRTWRAYKKLDQAKQWKSFIQRHCRGAVLDYLKSASAFEDGLGAKSDDPNQLRVRVDAETGSPDQILDQIVATVSTADLVSHGNAFAPNWELLSKMVGRDQDLHIVAKVLLGFTQEAIAAQMGLLLGVHLSRERISQRIYEFFERLDEPEHYYDRWVNQCIFALGLSERYKQPDEDNGEGWELQTFDLNDVRSFKLVQRYYRPTLLDYAEMTTETVSANELAV